MQQIKPGGIDEVESLARALHETQIEATRKCGFKPILATEDPDVSLGWDEIREKYKRIRLMQAGLLMERWKR